MSAASARHDSNRSNPQSGQKRKRSNTDTDANSSQAIARVQIDPIQVDLHEFCRPLKVSTPNRPDGTPMDISTTPTDNVETPRKKAKIHSSSNAANQSPPKPASDRLNGLNESSKTSSASHASKVQESESRHSSGSSAAKESESRHSPGSSAAKESESCKTTARPTAATASIANIANIVNVVNVANIANAANNIANTGTSTSHAEGWRSDAGRWMVWWSDENPRQARAYLYKLHNVFLGSSSVMDEYEYLWKFARSYVKKYFANDSVHGDWVKVSKDMPVSKWNINRLTLEFAKSNGERKAMTSMDNKARGKHMDSIFPQVGKNEHDTKCKKCRSTNVQPVGAQTSKADEGMRSLWTCRQCGHKF
jgi:DNA-directed RNA polymerase subunit M/transcription elongation factor TFIIS